MIEHIVAAYEGRLGADVLRDAPPLLLLDPARVYPTEDVATLRGLVGLRLRRGAGRAGDEALEPLRIGFTGEYFFVVDGHRRLSAALRTGSRWSRPSWSPRWTSRSSAG